MGQAGVAANILAFLLWFLPAIAALVVAIILLVGRGPTSPRCPRCHHSAETNATAGGRCPECGFVAKGVRDWRRRKRRSGIAALLLVIAVTLGAVPFRGPLRIWGIRTFLPRYQSIGQGKAGPVTVRREHDSWNDLGLPEWFGPDRIVLTLPDGTRQLIVSADHVELGASRSSGMPADDSAGFGGPLPGLDDSRTSQLLVTIPSGGSGGNITTMLFELSEHGATPLSVLANGWVEDRDHDDTYELVAFDATFAYRWTSGARSTRPAVRLRIEGLLTGMWSLDHAAMRSEAPSEAMLEQCRTSVRSAEVGTDAASREAWLGPLLQGTLLLLYSGQPERARAFLEEGWRGSGDELRTFEGEFAAAFASSPYAAHIRALGLVEEEKENGRPGAWP
jgi:hypothetical protein